MHMPFEIKSIKSPTHPLQVKQTKTQAVIQVDTTTAEQNSQSSSLILVFNIATIHMPRMLVEDYRDTTADQQDKNSRACMVSFYPEFETLQVNSPSISILIDCSNSMSGNIESSQKLARLMLDSLPASCQFNVTLFGSDFIDLFPFVQKNSAENLQKAIDWICNLKGNSRRGNTDLLNVIQSSLLFNDFSARRIDYEFSEIQNYILISDGHMTRSSELVAALKAANARKSSQVVNRIFSCSLGASANNHTLKLVARLTGASYDSFDGVASWADKVGDIMDKVCQPAAIQDIQVEWQNMEKADAYTKLGSGKFDYPLNETRVSAWKKEVFFC